nr:hypothetical protein [Actinomycetota bacterium]
VLAPADGRWQDGMASRRIEGEKLPRGIVVHHTLELVAHLCPGCGRQHSVAVSERDEPPMGDIQLNAWQG